MGRTGIRRLGNFMGRTGMRRLGNFMGRTGMRWGVLEMDWWVFRCKSVHLGFECSFFANLTERLN